jgi:NAD(P)-dependent dehydrogenase (short-subunit alcohol dehydrogenase family)
VALVTGASRGLGFAVARALGVSGVQLAALARTVGGLEELADAIEAGGGPTPVLVPLSLTDDGGLKRLGQALHERWGRLDLVVHCAAHAAPMSPAAQTAEKDFDTSFAVNLRGTQRLLTVVHPLLTAAPGGCFVHVGDDRAGAPFFGSYGASKAAAEALVRSWAAETRRTGPRVIVFQPRPMPTALRGRFHPGEALEGLAPCANEAARLLESLLQPVSSSAGARARLPVERPV